MSETESCMKCLICLFGDEVRLYFIVLRVQRGDVTGRHFII